MPEDAVDAEDTQQIVVNRRFGGFGLSDEALDILVEEYGYSKTEFDDDGDYVDPDAEVIDGNSGVMDHYSLTETREASTRTRAELVEVVERLGEDANGAHAKLEVVELPAEKEWVVTEYDGVETVREKHRKYPGGEYETGVFCSDDL